MINGTTVMIEDLFIIKINTANRDNVKDRGQGDTTIIASDPFSTLGEEILCHGIAPKAPMIKGAALQVSQAGSLIVKMREEGVKARAGAP
jgi:hypothetical protein